MATLDLSNETRDVDVNITNGGYSIYTGPRNTFISRQDFFLPPQYDSATTGSGDDYLVGDSRANTLQGGAGNDFISGDSGNDIILGGEGDDRLSGSNFGEVQGASGADNGQVDFIDAGGGHDIVHLGSGQNNALLGDGNDTLIVYGSGSLVVSTGTISGGTGTDTIEAGNVDLTSYELSGFEGIGGQAKLTVAQIRAFSTFFYTYDQGSSLGYQFAEISLSDGGIIDLRGKDTLNIRVYLSDISSTVYTSELRNTYIFLMNGASVWGGDGNDTLIGAVAIDYLSGGDGNDIIIGGGAANTPYGGDGLSGGPGNDFLNAVSSSSNIPGVYDRLDGGAGDDEFWVDAEDQVLDLDQDENVWFVTSLSADRLQVTIGNPWTVVTVFDDTLSKSESIELLKTGTNLSFLQSLRWEAFSNDQYSGIRIFSGGLPLFDGQSNNVNLGSAGGLNPADFSGADATDALGGDDVVTLPESLGRWSAWGAGISSGSVHFDAGAGNDTVTGGALNDWIDGGSGRDTVVLAGRMRDFEIGRLRHRDDLAIRRGDGGDIVTNVEFLKFTDRTIGPDAFRVKSASDLFKEEGKLAFLATLAKGAYRAVGDDKASQRAYEKADAELILFNALDLPSLKPVSGNGIRDGLFVNGNAEALVGRCDDALFVSFCGTSLRTPLDVIDWGQMRSQFKLFDPLIAALKTYLADGSGIGRIFVTGHSLGASMIQPFLAEMKDAGLPIEAVTFATAGYGRGTDRDDARVTNFWSDYDPIQLVSGVSTTLGDHNTFNDGIGLTSSHSMDLYLAIAQFMKAEGLDLKDFRKLNGVNYESVFLRVLQSDDGTFKPGVQQDNLSGTGAPNLMVGGAKADILNGKGGIDTLLGGDGVDTLTGGAGRDFLTGGDGADRFVFDARGIDIVADFSPGEDHIVLSRSIFGALARGDLPRNAFNLGAAARDGSDRILYDRATGALRYDPDGLTVGGEYAVQFAILSPRLALSSGDVIVA